MEKLVNLIAAQSKRDHILGENQQGLQLLIQPNEGVIAKQDLVSYHSPDLEEFFSDTKHALETLLEESKSGPEAAKNLNSADFANLGSGKLVASKNYIKYINTSKELQYIGISSAGKVMVIDPNIYGSFFVRSSKVIAYGTNIQLFSLPEINKNLCLIFGQRHSLLDFLIIKNNNLCTTSTTVHNLYLQSESKCLIIIISRPANRKTIRQKRKYINSERCYYWI